MQIFRTRRARDHARQPGWRDLILCSTLLLAAAGSTAAQTVTVPGDFPTIQSAINAVVNNTAADGVVIAIQPGTYNEALLINSTPRSLTLRGVNGPAETVVDALGSGQSAIRILRASGTVRVEGLSFRNGSGVPGTGGGFTIEDASPQLSNVVFEHNAGVDAGGGVLTRSHAQFSDCTIRSNSAGRFGGGIVITTGSRPTFSNCQIRNNTSGTGGPGDGSIGSGGGVHVNDASPTFRGCVIAGNQSKFAAGGILHMGIFGSAYGPAVLLLEDTEVANNTSTRFSPADNPAEGGGIHIEDNAVGHLIRARILNNAANTAGGLSAYRARYEITSSVVEGNHAQDPLALGGFGGGIGISSNNLSTPLQQASTLILKDTVVRGNAARVGAGIFATGDQLCGSPRSRCNPASAPRATVQIADSLIDSNAAGLYGGGMRIDRADLTVSNTHILSNSVGASGQSYGGGILMASGVHAAISGTTIASNAAVDLGGGLFVDDGSIVNVTQSQVYRNTAASGGGLYVGSIGAPSGTIESSTLADNSSYQIHEQACSPLQRTILRYQNNAITPQSGQSDLYYSTCGGATSTISGFNNLPHGHAIANTSAPPGFRSFLATPGLGPSVLSWSVSRATSVEITGVGAFSGDTGSTLVTPVGTTTYTLTSSAGPAGSATASVVVPQALGASTDSPLAGDFDGDGRHDPAVYRASTGQWFIAGSTSGFAQYAWGAPRLGDMPVPADYDGDVRTDIAVYRSSSGQWFILNSSSGLASIVSWGAPALGDTPVPADYDGDNKADLAVYRRSTGEWFIRLSGGGSRQVAWGAPSLGDVPVPRDYDGDSRDDIAVYRSTTGQWFIARSSGGTTSQTWGAPALDDIPVPADYDGDGKADLAVARKQSGEWYIQRSLGGMSVIKWGLGDQQLFGDFDGDGRADVALWNAAAALWLIRP